MLEMFFFTPITSSKIALTGYKWICIEKVELAESSKACLILPCIPYLWKYGITKLDGRMLANYATDTCIISGELHIKIILCNQYYLEAPSPCSGRGLLAFQSQIWSSRL